jgi:broad specificity phosphatase PhoE
MTTTFKKLTLDWNAEPNDPEPKVAVWGHDIVLSFFMNKLTGEPYGREEIGLLRFSNCRRYRLGSTNDEG